MPNDLVGASITWHHIQSFDARISLLERRMKLIAVSAPASQQWPSLLKRLKAASETRNRIVHGHVDQILPDWHFVVRPYDMDFTAILRNRHNNPAFHFNSERLKQEGASFLQLGQDLSAFSQSSFEHHPKHAGD